MLPTTRCRRSAPGSRERGFDPAIDFIFKGEDEEQQESQAFLGQAFVAALFLIAIILVLQFNSFYQTLPDPDGGRLLDDRRAARPAGRRPALRHRHVRHRRDRARRHVVNNNIVLIDTYNELRARGMEPREAILRTGAQRLRPVLLTAINTCWACCRWSLGSTSTSSRARSPWRPVDRLVGAALAGGRGGLTFATMITLC